MSGERMLVKLQCSLLLKSNGSSVSEKSNFFTSRGFIFFSRKTFFIRVTY